MGFRTVSFQKVVKRAIITVTLLLSFRTVSFQKVVKPFDEGSYAAPEF